MGATKAHILVLGAGFGGLTFCKKFRHPDAYVTVVDRTNHHLFQPLLYQVATAGLAAVDIAQPVRAILSGIPNVTVVLGQAQDFDLANRRVTMQNTTLTYDYLVLALGGVTSYFGHPEWEEFAPGLKTLDDALRIRREVLLAFELAENERDPKAREALMTMVIVGGGPTGVELAGACAELARHVLRRDFDRIDPGQAKVILIEGSPVILSHMPRDLAESAQEQLQRLGVEVRTSCRVKNIAEGRVDLEGGATIFAKNILWAAGVSATPLTRKLGVELDKAGRVKVNPDLSLPGHPNVFAIGDMVLVIHKDGKPVPGVSPAAMQMAGHVVRIIEDELSLGAGRAPRPAFKYWDKGTMATIGRSAAVAYSGPIKMKGFIAWLAWLFVHLVFLIGLRNKVMVFMQWVYSYLTYKRGARIITGWPPKTTEARAAAPASVRPAEIVKTH
jgi:NADH:ubiquinone reductase (H+-translocating)